SGSMRIRSYAAFISYSHADEAFAGKLHRFVETWRTPRRLTGGEGRDGAVPARLFPVFRDREELPTSADLGAVIRTALENSRYLVVLCSPRAAASVWVDQEILEFKRLHGEGRIIAAILEGEPDQCFPPALRRRIGDDGILTDTPTEPIAADFRAGKDGWRLGTLKVLAGLLGVNLDDLVRRENRRRRQRRMLLAASAATVVVALALGAQAWFHAEGRRALQAEATRGLTELRAGDVFSGADRLLGATHALGADATLDQRRFAEALTARLVPYPEALGALEDGTIVAWRGRTYMKREGALHAVADALLQAPFGGHTILARPGRIEAIDSVTLAPAWTTALEDGERLCGLWADAESGRLYLEGEYVGMTMGASYGFNAWMDPATGVLDPIGPGHIGEQLCSGADEPSEVTGRFTRLDHPVDAFAWPRMRREALLWEPTDFAPRPPFLPEEDDRAQLAALFGEGDERAAIGESFIAHGLEIVAACNETRYMAGYQSVGNSGGIVATCAIRGEEAARCTSHDFIGVIREWTIAPDCSAFAALGYGLTDRRGLLMVGADLETIDVDDMPRTEEMRHGAFSPSGQRFAATDGEDRVFVFERTGTGYKRIATHETGARIHLITFLGDGGVTLVVGKGELRGLDAASGTPLWPAVALGPGIGDAIEREWERDDNPNATLVATASGDVIAFAIQLEESAAAVIDPSLLPIMPDGTRAAPTEGRRTSYVRFFDGTLGVPIGGRLSLGWTLGPDALEAPWRNALLGRRADGSLVFSYAPHAAFTASPPAPVETALPELTAMGPDGPLTTPPNDR
ncbi:MAG: toll/interleukin-1 receptor domain-containing protein, partial [Zavarzinia sp.]|nr:toll/interleukin-1 receptor domain-containing protein [Zavarzinia sp.]